MPHPPGGGEYAIEEGIRYSFHSLTHGKKIPLRHSWDCYSCQTRRACLRDVALCTARAVSDLYTTANILNANLILPTSKSKGQISLAPQQRS